MDDDSVFFDEASAALTERSLGRIDEFARNLRRGGSRASVAIIGFAGSEGSADYKETLGAKRADAVRERLIERGVPRSRISVKSAGQDRRFSNWRARRVEMILIPNAVAESVN
jgi:outer membrane protein OmpA-like peptidoglycan-associated protein